jgi:hypothetical protein
MTTARFLAAVALAASAAACTNLAAPSGTATLTVKVSALCDGSGPIDVRVDGNLIGTIMPGGTTSARLSVGTHTISALSVNGFHWGPFSKAINRDFDENLTC